MPKNHQVLFANINNTNEFTARTLQYKIKVDIRLEIKVSENNNNFKQQLQFFNFNWFTYIIHICFSYDKFKC